MTAAQLRGRLLWTAVAVLVLIGLAAATRRALVLLLGIGAGPGAQLDAGFARHPLVTFIHIVPAAFFMALAPFQFAAGMRARRLGQHRWTGRLLVPAGLIVGVSALVMAWQMPIGGANETVATTFFAVLFLFSLLKAFRHARRGEIRPHREWMLRAFAIALGVATTRPIVGAFFAARRLAPQEFFGIAFWLGFSATALAGEVWINVTRADVAAAGRRTWT